MNKVIIGFLEEIEWQAQDVIKRLPMCPVCVGLKKEGHKSHCGLFKALTELRKQPLNEPSMAIVKLEEANRQYIPERDAANAHFLHPIIVKDCIDQTLIELRKLPTKEELKADLRAWIEDLFEELHHVVTIPPIVRDILPEFCQQFTVKELIEVIDEVA